MKIDSVGFKKHFLFENTIIHFFSDSAPNVDQSNKSFGVEFGDSVARNSYTYFIGENGTGKTALLKSLVGIFNFNSKNPKKKISGLSTFFGKNKYENYIRFSESQLLSECIFRGM